MIKIHLSECTVSRNKDSRGSRCWMAAAVRARGPPGRASRCRCNGARPHLAHCPLKGGATRAVKGVPTEKVSLQQILRTSDSRKLF